MPPWVPPGWVLAPGGFLEVVLKGQSPGFAFPVLGAPSWLAAGCWVGAGGGAGCCPGSFWGYGAIGSQGPRLVQPRCLPGCCVLVPVGSLQSRSSPGVCGP